MYQLSHYVWHYAKFIPDSFLSRFLKSGVQDHAQSGVRYCKNRYVYMPNTTRLLRVDIQISARSLLTYSGTLQHIIFNIQYCHFDGLSMSFPHSLSVCSDLQLHEAICACLNLFCYASIGSDCCWRCANFCFSTLIEHQLIRVTHFSASRTHYSLAMCDLVWIR